MKTSRSGNQTIDAEVVEVEVLDTRNAPAHRTPPARMMTGRAVARRGHSPLLLLAALPALLLLALVVVIAAAVAVLWLLARAVVRRLRLLLH